jgi:hypothetical protein
LTTGSARRTRPGSQDLSGGSCRRHNDDLTGFLGCVEPHQRIPELWRNDEMESFIARSFC